MWISDVRDNKLISTSSRDTNVLSIRNIPEFYSQGVLVYLLLILIPLCLYTFRYLDNNRLVSWYWSLSQSQFFLLLGVLSVALVATAILARIDIPEKKSVLLVSVLALLAPVPFWNGPETIIDSARYFSQAKFLELYGVSYFFREWGHTIFAWTDLPLIPFIYGLLFSVFGEQRTVIQISGSMFFSGTVIIVWLLGKDLWSHQHGIAGAVLLLGVPYLYSQLPLMLVDVPAMFFMSLAILTTVRAIKYGNGLYLFYASISVVLALLSKYTNWLLLSVIPFALLFSGIQLADKKNLARRLFIITFSAAVLFSVFVLWKLDVVWLQLYMLSTFQLEGLDRWQESNLSSYFFQIYPLLTVLAACSVFMAIKNKDRCFVIIAAMPLLMIILDIQRMRYLVPVLPMLALMAACSIAEIKNVFLQRFTGYGVACSAFLIALLINDGFVKNTSAENLRQAGEYINQMNYEEVEVLVLPQTGSLVNPVVSIPQLDMYTRKTVLTVAEGVPGVSNIVTNRARQSSIRFTWEYVLPKFYQGSGVNDHRKRPLVIVYSGRNQLEKGNQLEMLRNYRLVREYQKSTGVFRYRTMINIYEPV